MRCAMDPAAAIDGRHFAVIAWQGNRLNLRAMYANRHAAQGYAHELARCAARGVYVLKVRLVATFDGAERVPAEGKGGVA